MWKQNMSVWKYGKSRVAATPTYHFLVSPIHYVCSVLTLYVSGRPDIHHIHHQCNYNVYSLWALSIMKCFSLTGILTGRLKRSGQWWRFGIRHIHWEGCLCTYMMVTSMCGERKWNRSRIELNGYLFKIPVHFMQEDTLQGSFISQRSWKATLSFTLTKLLAMYSITVNGRTSALIAMLGRDPLTIYCSTPLVKRPVYVCFIMRRQSGSHRQLKKCPTLSLKSYIHECLNKM